MAELPENPAVAPGSCARPASATHEALSGSPGRCAMRQLLIMLAFVVFLLFLTMIAAPPVAG
ncbi:MAG TPA: hypothetical protein VJS11_06780 [Acidobacteriaceae bacterium]|nr:hypothetical protein [Acidobacteriaceae bacterium]